MRCQVVEILLCFERPYRNEKRLRDSHQPKILVIAVIKQPFNIFHSWLDRRRRFARRRRTFDHLKNLERSGLRIDLEAAVRRDLVVVLNGVVCATTRAEPENEQTASFAVMLPSNQLVSGQNYLQFFIATAVSADEIRLQPAL